MLDAIAGRTRGFPTSENFGRAAWRMVFLRAAHGFMRHTGIDSAATLTFFASLAMFPATLTVISAFALADGKRGAVRDLLTSVEAVASDTTAALLLEPVKEFLTLPNPLIAFLIGFVLMIWSASAYATAFGRAVNAVYEVLEGRMLIKFRLQMLLVTLFTTVAFAVILGILLVTPTVADAIAGQFGFGDPWLTAWNFGKWPLLAALALVIVAILYYFTPNIARPRMRWVSWGSLFAIVGWVIATAGFGLYVSTIGPYGKIYGWIGGGIVLLLWLYLTNIVLVFGAELDAEIVRMRQLKSGIEAEEHIRLPLRDTSRNLLIADQRARDIAAARALRTKQVP